MKRLILVGMTLLFTGPLYAGLRYNDCVEIKDDFFSREGQQLVGYVTDKRTVNGVIEYLVGNILFGVWFPESDLVKIDESICREAEEPTGDKV